MSHDACSTFFQAAVENSYDVIELLREDGTILYISPSVERVLGFEPQALIGTNAFALVHPDDLPKLQKEFAQALIRGQGEVSAYRCHTINGEWRWSKSTGSVLNPDERPRTIIVNSRDITQQEESHHALTMANRDMVTIWESMTDAFYALDADWCVTYLNSAGERLLQRERKKVVGRNLWEAFPDAVDSEAFQHYHRAMQEQTEVTFEEFYPPLASWFELHVYPSEAGLAVYFRNITERKLSEAALRESEERFRQMAESIDEVFWLFDPLQEKLLYVSPAFERVWGYPVQSLIEQTVRFIDTVHPEDRNRVLAALEHQSRPGGYSQEHRIVRPDGSMRWVWARTFPIYNEQGDVYRIAGIAQDISERKQVEDALRESEAHLINAQNLAHLGYLEMDSSSGKSRWSDETFRILGLEPKMLEPDVQLFMEHIHPEDLGKASLAAHALFQSGKPFDFEHRIVRPSGEVRWVQVRAEVIARHEGQPVRFASTLLDITDRKQYEEAQARLAMVVESSQDAISGLDLNGLITSWNQGAEQLYGYSTEEVIGQPITLLTPPHRPQEVTNILDQLRQGASIKNLETQRRRKDGSLVDVSLSIAPMFDASGKVIGSSAITRDITEQKQAKRELEKSHSLLEAALESTADAIMVVDAQQRVSRYNQKFLDLWGITKESLQNNELSAVRSLAFPQLKNPDIVSRQIDFLNSDPQTEGLVELSLNDGRTFEAYCKEQRSDGQNIGLVWSIRDVTERHRAEELQLNLNSQLEQERQRLDEILANVPGIVWETIVEPQTGYQRAIYVSAYLITMLGYQPREWINSPDFWLRILHPEDRQSALDESAEKIQSEREFSQQYRMISKDGRALWVETHCAVVRDENGSIIGLRGVTMDISHHVEAQQEQTRLALALQQANRELEQRVQDRTGELNQVNISLREEVIQRQMAMGALQEAVQAHQEAKEEAERANQAKSEFLSRMSHELRTPLNAILGFGQILEMEELNDEERDSVEHILKGGKHLLELINEVLDIARVESGSIELSLEPVIVGTVVEESLDLVRPLAAAENIRLHMESAEAESLYVLADHQRLKQVLLNLLANAVKYNRSGGQVTVRCVAVPDDLLRIEVQDTGRGISPQNMEKLFVPFERLEAEQQDIEGTGLGLMLARRLTEAMGGTLGVHSTVGVGSTFFVELSLTQCPLEQLNDSDIGDSSAHQLPNYQNTVLCIEDNQANFSLIERVLASRPEIKLIGAMQGSVGLELARKHRPNLILLDQHLPDMPGREVLRRLRADSTTEHIPIVVLSADATQRQIDRLLSDGAFAYLTKPLNVPAFLGVLEEILPHADTPPPKVL